MACRNPAAGDLTNLRERVDAVAKLVSRPAVGTPRFCLPQP